MPPAVADASPSENAAQDTDQVPAAAEPSKREPTVLDRFLWTVVQEVDEGAVLDFMFTPRESRRLHSLERKRETPGGLTQEEELEHFDLKVVRQIAPLMKAAVFQKRAGWRGDSALAEAE